MQFLKGLAISLLSFILFLCLSTFSVVFMLNQTILNPDFITSQLDELDLTSLAKEMVIDQVSQDLSQQIAGQFPGAELILNNILNDTMADLEPWIKEKTNEMVYATYEYMVGDTQSLSVNISLDPVKDTLAANMKAALLDSPPPQLAMAPPEMREMIVSGIEQGLTQQVPPSFTFDESQFPAESLSSIEQARQYLGYAQTAYPILIGLMVLIALLIILLYRSVKGATRNLGGTVLTYGILGYAGIFASQYLIGTQTGSLGLPVALQSWLPQFLDGVWAPIQTFNISVAIAGVVLIIVSIVYPKKEPAD